MVVRKENTKKNMKIKLIMLLAILSVTISQAQTVTTRVVGNSALTNSLIVTTKPTKLFTILGQNTSADVGYIQVFNTVAGATNGATPILSFPVAASPQYYSLDFGYYGADFDAIVVKTSSTSTTLTLTSASYTIQAITRLN